MNLAFSELLRTVLWHRFMLLFYNRISVWCRIKDSVALKSKRLLIPPTGVSRQFISGFLRHYFEVVSATHKALWLHWEWHALRNLLLKFYWEMENTGFSRTAFTTPTDIQLNKTKAGKTSLIYLNCALWTDTAFLSALTCFDSLS